MKQIVRRGFLISEKYNLEILITAQADGAVTSILAHRISQYSCFAVPSGTVT